jgi:hypothetical protein
MMTIISLMNRYTVTLTEDERKSLQELSSKGKT